MAGEHVQRIIGRAVTELAYRALLFSDPRAALAGYTLTEQEILALTAISSQGFDALTTELEQRISQATDYYLKLD